MRRLLPIGLALAFALCAHVLQAVELPGRALACSCRVPTRPLQEIAADPNAMLVVATIGQSFGTDFEAQTVLGIERAFKGSPPDQTRVKGIGPQGAACQLGAIQGERWVLSVYVAPDGRFGVSSCGTNAKLGTPAGDALVADAVGVFGEGQTPAPAPESPAAPIDLAPWVAGWGWLLALIVLSVGIFGLVFAASRRRPG